VTEFLGCSTAHLYSLSEKLSVSGDLSTLLTSIFRRLTIAGGVPAGIGVRQHRNFCAEDHLELTGKQLADQARTRVVAACRSPR